MYYAGLTLSDVVFLLIVRAILGIIGANFISKNYVFLRSSCGRLPQGARHITGFGQEFVLLTNEQAHDLAEAERLQLLEQPHWARRVALELRAPRNCHPQTLTITGAARPVRSPCRSRGQTSK